MNLSKIWPRFGQKKNTMFPKEIWKRENSATKSKQQMCWWWGDGSACDEGFKGGEGEAGGDSGSIGDYGDSGGSWHHSTTPQKPPQPVNVARQ